MITARVLRRQPDFGRFPEPGALPPVAGSRLEKLPDELCRLDDRDGGQGQEEDQDPFRDRNGARLEDRVSVADLLTTASVLDRLQAMFEELAEDPDPAVPASVDLATSRSS